MSTAPAATSGGPPPASKIPPEFMGEFSSKMAEITREQMDKKIEEFTAKAQSGAIDLRVQGTRHEDRVPVMKHQIFYERFDPSGLKGKGAAFGQFCKAHMIAGMRGKPIADVAKELEKGGQIDGFVAKALLESTFSTGGSTIAPEIVADYIELLRAALVLRDLGMTVLPMKGQELQWNRQNSPASASYRGEAVAIPYSQLSTGQLKFQARELNVITLLSINLLNDSGPMIDMMVRDDMVAVMALRADLAGIRGNGLNDTPMGLLNLMSAVNQINPAQAGADATFQEISTGLGQLIRAVKGVTGTVKKGGFIITPRVEEYLFTVSSTLGIYPFRDQLEQGKIRGFPYRTTSQIPDTLGGGGDGTEVYFADFSELCMAENEELLIESSREATVVDGNGNTVHAFQAGMMAIKSTARHDYQLRHQPKAAALTPCLWGNSLGG